MNIKKSGFTLIEVLTVIVILGILAVISYAMFNNYIEQGNDAKRIKVLKNIESALKLDMPEKQESEIYIYNTNEIKELLSKFSYSLKSGNGGLCYFIGMAHGNNSSGEDNEFVIATWGKTTSTIDKDKAGILVVGTLQGVTNLKNARINGSSIMNAYSLYAADFSCQRLSNFEKVYKAFVGNPAFMD